MMRFSYYESTFLLSDAPSERCGRRARERAIARQGIGSYIIHVVLQQQTLVRSSRRRVFRSFPPARGAPFFRRRRRLPDAPDLPPASSRRLLPPGGLHAEPGLPGDVRCGDGREAEPRARGGDRLRPARARDEVQTRRRCALRRQRRAARPAPRDAPRVARPGERAPHAVCHAQSKFPPSDDSGAPEEDESSPPEPSPEPPEPPEPPGRRSRRSRRRPVAVAASSRRSSPPRRSPPRGPSFRRRIRGRRIRRPERRRFVAAAALPASDFPRAWARTLRLGPRACNLGGCGACRRGAMEAPRGTAGREDRVAAPSATARRFARGDAVPSACSGAPGRGRGIGMGEGGGRGVRARVSGAVSWDGSTWHRAFPRGGSRADGISRATGRRRERTPRRDATRVGAHLIARLADGVRARPRVLQDRGERHLAPRSPRATRAACALNTSMRTRGRV